MYEPRNLVGKKYPVTSADTGEVIGYRTIKKAFDCTNAAAYFIQLTENSDSYMIIGFKEAARLMDNEYTGPDKEFK